MIRARHAARLFTIAFSLALVALYAPDRGPVLAQASATVTVIANVDAPFGGVIRGSDGFLYGTSQTGPGSATCGYVYRLDPQSGGTFGVTILHQFTNTPDGCQPNGELVEGPDGLLYGTTRIGGPNVDAIYATQGTGTIYSIAKAGGALTLLRPFALQIPYLYYFIYPEGYAPTAGLTLAPDGNFYGMTSGGGSGSAAPAPGTIFRFRPSGVLDVLYNFNVFPIHEGTPQDALTLIDGNLYGTVTAGGTSDNPAGALFRMTLSGAVSRVFTFPTESVCACYPFGANPYASPTGAAGGIYVVARDYGPLPGGYGTVVRVDGSTATAVHRFSGASDGGRPHRAMTLGTDGYLYGLTSGANSTGPTIFRLSPDGLLFETLYSFPALGGSGLQGRLLEISPGQFIGTSTSGGAGGRGMVYRLSMPVPNSPPSAHDGAFPTNEDTPVSSQLSADDPDGDALTYSVVTNGSHGVATVNPSTGVFTYTPNANESGPDQFTFKVNDGEVDSNPATVSITINPINDAPMALDSVYPAIEDTPLSASFQATDVDGPTLAFSIVSNGAKGTAVMTNAATGAFTYTPNPNANGSDVLTFQVFDGTVFSNVGTFTINIAAVNDPPSPQSGAVTTTRGVAVSGTLQATDIDSTGLTFSVATQPAQGYVTITNASTGAFTYTPNTGATSDDSFTFAVSDGSAIATATERVFIVVANTLHVLPSNAGPAYDVNDAGTAVGYWAGPGGSRSYLWTAAAQMQPMTLDPAINTIFPISGNPLRINNSGLVAGRETYTGFPRNGAAMWNPATGILTRLYEGSPVTVDPTSLSRAINNNGVIVGTYRGNSQIPFIWRPSSGLGFIFPQSSGGADALDVNDSEVVVGYCSAACGSSSTVAYRWTQAAGPLVLPPVVTGVPHEAHAINNSNEVVGRYISGASGGVFFWSLSTGTVNLGAPAGTGTPQFVVINDSRQIVATFALASGGSRPYLYRIPAGAPIQAGTWIDVNTLVSPGGFTLYTVRGINNQGWMAGGGGSGTETVGFVVIPQTNSAPTASNASFPTNEDTPVSNQLSASDPDSDALIYSIVTNGAHGVATVNPSTGVFTYTPNANESGPDQFTFMVNDGTVNSNVATVTISISAINDAPLALNGQASGVEDTPLLASFQATDVDGPSLVFSIVSNGAKGTAVITNAATGAFTYTPNPNASGSDVLTFQAFDGTVFSNVGTFTINIAAVSDPPSAQSGVVTTTEGVAVSGTLQATDIDSTGLTFSVATQPAQGSVTITNASTGAFTYTPNPGVTGYDPFTFAVSDGANVANATEMVFVVASSPRWPGQTMRPSVAGDGTQGDRESVQPVLSADGRYAAFYSGATNLVAGDSNGASDVFVHDRQTGETQRVSVASDGTEGNSFSSHPALSADGRYVAFRSDGSNLVAGDTNSALDVFVRDRQTGETRRVSVASDGAEGNGVSDRPSVSADGRYVAFRSDASNLVANDTNATSDVFVHDRQTGQTQRLSVASDATPGNDYSYEPSLSADGRYVVFSSFASNLVAGDTNNRADVFVHDRQTGETRRVSVASAGTQGNGDSYQPSLSADGRYVAFISVASNLVAGDTNFTPDVFVHDRQTAETWRVSVASDGTQENADSYQTSLSADGRYVAFVSVASNLVAGDTNGTRDMFVHDRQTGETRRVSVASDGTQGNNHSIDASLSADARYAAFTSYASNLVAGDTNGYVDVFVVGAAPSPSVPAATDDAITTVEDIAASGVLNATDPNGAPLTFALVSSGALGTAALTNTATGAYTYTPHPDANGTDTFTFQASNGAVTSNVATVTVTITPINDAPLALNGQASGLEDTPLSATLQATDVDGPSLVFSIVANGSKGTAVITNVSTGAFTYTPNANANGTDVVTFRAFDGTVFSNVATFTINIAAVNDPPAPQSGVVTATEGSAVSGTLGGGDIDSTGLTFSVETQPAQGSVAITNASTGAFIYTPNPGVTGYDPFTFAVSDGANVANATEMVFVVANSPRWPGQTVRVSLSTTGAQGNGQNAHNSISADGRYVVFDSDAANLIPNDTNSRYDVFVHDRATGALERVSVSSTGLQTDGSSFSKAISADGRYVVFSSSASNLVPDDSNAATDLFVHDRVLHETVRVNLSSTGQETHPLTTDIAAAISANGQFIAFHSDAPDVVPSDTNGTFDVFVRDMHSGSTFRVSVSETGIEGNGRSSVPSISADGRTIAFGSSASTLVSGDTNNRSDVFVRDLASGRVELVSQGSGGQPANHHSLGPVVSADGRYVAFSSDASNLVASDTNSARDVFIRDRVVAQTQLVSVTPAGTQGNGRSGSNFDGDHEVSISADGRYVAFVSAATVLVPGDSNGVLDVFVSDRTSRALRRISVASDGAEVNAASANGSLSADGRFVSFDSSAATFVSADTNANFDVFVVGGVNVSPTAQSIAGSGGALASSVTFVYPGTSWSVSSNAPWITITNQSSTNGNGTVSYSVAPNTGAQRVGTLTIALQTVTVTQAASTTPVASSGTVTTNEDVAVNSTLSATDPNGDPLTYSIVSNGVLGTATIANPATGAYTYTPNANANGTDTFTFTASDGTNTSNVAIMTVTIAPVNDAPVANPGSLAVTEDVAATGTFSAVDVDGPTLVFSIVANGSKGTAVITNAATGAFTYTPNANGNGTDVVTFQAFDGSVFSNVATFTINIAAVNDPPTPQSGVVTATEGGAVSGTLGGGDIDSTGLTFSIATQPARGSVTITNASTGAFTYTPNPGVTGYDPFTFAVSDGTNAANATETVFIVANSPRWPGQTMRASVSSSGAQANSWSDEAALSADGRYVAFTSWASNLVTGDTVTNDVFVRDRQTGVTTRVSVASDGTEGTGSSPALSADGRFVVFSSGTGYLVADDTNLAEDVFVHDRQTGVTRRVSVASNGTQGNASSGGPTVSADARFVAFHSDASNLVAGDTNEAADVFVHDRQTGDTTRISVASDGTQGNADSAGQALSADGRFVAFTSLASNIVADHITGQHVFVHDRQTGETARVSVGSDGTPGNSYSASPALSADGRFVAFLSNASNLVAGDTNDADDVFVHDRATGVTIRVSVASGGIQGNGGSGSPALSADGRYVTFMSIASNLVVGDTNETVDAFVHDRHTGVTRRVSVASDGAAATGYSDRAVVSADGQFVAFSSVAMNLVAGDTNGEADVFVVGGVSVDPTRQSFPAVGGSGAVGVSFVYPGTDWTATSNVPWITITNQSSTNANGTVSYSVAPNLGAERVGTLTVASRTVTITQVASTTPVASDGPVSTNEDVAVNGTLSATAPNGGVLTFAIVTNGTRGTATITNPATGAFTYTPNANANGTDTFTFTASDGTNTSNVGTMTVTIAPVNDTPVANAGSTSTNEDTAVIGTLRASDVDGDGLTFSIVGNGAIGVVTITNPATGAFTYTPNANASGTDSFTFRVSDGTVLSNLATVTVTVNAVDDAPVASNGTLAVSQDTVANSTFVATDIDGPALTYRIVANGALGTAVVTNAATGAFTYTPNAGATGSDSIQFRASDGTLDSNAGTISITIAATAPLTVTVDAPNGGERVFIGAPTTIRWTATGATSFDVELSRTNGTAFAAIPGCTALPSTARSCVWTPTSPTSGVALIRVTARNAAGATANDRSNAVFAIVTGTPTITVSAPNSAVTWAIGMQRAITWTHNLGAVSRVGIELSRNGGSTWETLAASVQNTTASSGTFNWTVTGPPTSTALIRVTWLDGPATDVSNTVFAIQSPAVTVTTPTTAVSWRSGETRAIVFSHNLGAGQVVNLDLTRDGGATWTPLTAVTTTTSASASYSWLVTIPATTRARVRATWASNPAVTDTSDTDFTITPRVRVMSPNTATTWGAGTTRTITWNHNLPTGETVDIAFSPDNGATWVPVASGVANATATTGIYTGRLPTTPTTQGLIKVSWSRDPMDGDVNDVPLVIVPASVTVNSPGANQTWTVGSTRNILWSHTLGAAETVSIDVSRDGGTTWANITPAATNAATGGTYSWVVTGPATTTARIRVSWTVNGTVQSVSGNFRIQ